MLDKLDNELKASDINRKYDKFKTDITKTLNKDNKSVDGNAILIFGNLIDQCKFT